MKVVLKPIEGITPYPDNPRRITTDAIHKVAQSIKAFGWQQPIVVDNDGVIIAGHTRYAAAEYLGLDKVPCVVADHLSEAEALAYRIADNRTRDETDWDTDLLPQQIFKLSEMKFDMSLTAFDTEEIDRHLDRAKKRPVSFEASPGSGRTEYECPKCGHRWSP